MAFFLMFRKSACYAMYKLLLYRHLWLWKWDC